MIEYTKKDWRFAAIVTLLLFVLGACTLTLGIPEWGDDHAAYINEGIAIAEGRFEEQTRRNYSYHASELPKEAEDGRLVYVWGYPLFIAGIYKLVGFDRVNYSSIIWYKLIPLLNLSLTGGVLTLLLRRRFSLYAAAGAALVFCMSGDLFEALNTLYSDPLFLFFTMLTLLLMEVFSSPTTGDGGKKLWLGLFYGFSLWMTYETRLSGFTVCIVAFLGHGLQLIRQRATLSRKSILLHLFPYFLMAALILISERLWLASATPNISDLGKAAEEDVAGRYMKRLFEYFDTLPRLPFKGTGYVFLAACILGIIVKGFNQDNLHMSLLMIGTLIVVFRLPYFQGLRYLYNVLPIMIIFTLYGFQAVGKIATRVWKGTKGTVGRVITVALAVEILFFSCANQVYRAGYNFAHWDERYSYDVYSDEAKEVYQYINENVSMDEVIAFGKPRAMYLNTGHETIWVGKNGHTIDEAQYYLKHKVTDFDEGEIDTSGMEVVIDNDVFTFYRIL